MKGKRWWVVVVLSTMLGAACSAGGASPRASVQVALSDFKIETQGVAKAGAPLAVNVRNDAATPHTLAIDVAGKTYETSMLQQGMAATLDLPSLEPGSYTMWCTVPGHREAGMQVSLTVESDAGHAAKMDGGDGGGAKALSPAEMDYMHEAGVKAFPAKTAAQGGRILEPKLDGAVKVFELTATRIKWEVTPGQPIDAMAYNGQIPGPELHTQAGDRVRVVLHNELPESTAIHFHGLRVPNDMDGVPFITQPPVQPGHSFTYEFTITDGPGTYMYHSHHNATEQVTKGLLGAFVVDPAVRSWDVAQTIIVGDGPLGYTINGKGFPATQPIAAKLGQKVLVRFINAGQLAHPMHLHGFHFTVVSRDGVSITPFVVDTLSVGPGEIYDAVFTADAPGVWAFHCHILSHAESDHGMHGMVTAVVVKD